MIGPEAIADYLIFQMIGMKTPARAETNIPPVNEVPIVKASNNDQI